MRERFGQVIRFWRAHVFKYPGWWGMALALQLLFFTLSGVLPFAFKQVIDALTALDEALFATWITAFIALEITQAILLYARGYATRRLDLMVMRDLKTAVYRRFHTMPFEQALKVKTGEALQRLTSDVSRCSPLIIKSFSELVGHVVLVLIVLTLMFAMAPLLAGISVAFVGVYAVGFQMYGKRAAVKATGRQEAEARYIAEAEEGLGALYSVRVQAGLKGLMSRFSRALDLYLQRDFALYKLNLLFQGGFTTLVTVVSWVAILLTGAWLAFKGETTVGTLVAFSQYINWLYVFVHFMSGFAAEIEPAFVSLRRVEEVLTWTEEWNVEEPAAPAELPDAPYAIEVRELDLTLGDTPIFRGLSLTIPRGSITAVVGRSGLGKTTLLNVLLGLYRVPPGKVYLFGRDAAAMPLPERLGFFAVVEQEPRFFSTGSGVSPLLSPLEADLATVAEKLGLKDFTEGLLSRDIASAKLSELSGGERKRLGILRGLLREAPILLLDEPTAFLDAETAERIVASLGKSFSGRTIVVFTHDPSVLRYCEAAVELPDGRQQLEC